MSDLSDISLDPGNVLSSRAVSSQVLSACEGLTSVFGMGTGGSLQLLSPEILCGCRGTHRVPHLKNCTVRVDLSRSSFLFPPLPLRSVSFLRFAFRFAPFLSFALLSLRSMALSDQALGLLVSSSSTPLGASTDDLSTSSSLRDLT